MNNKEYGDLVNSGIYPEDRSVPLDTPFEDNRGVIQNLWLASSGSITLIVSNPGSIRAQHKHINDFHATYIISGTIEYTELEDDEKTIKYQHTYHANDMFFTKPGVFHIMKFLTYTTMITVNNIVKNHENYENSIQRMNHEKI